MHAELVFDAARKDIVARTERAVSIDHELGNEKQRDPLGAGGRVRQARQHEMHDVVGHVVLAIGDEDLRPLDAIGAVGLLFGAGAQRADVGAGLRLGELHRAGPFAGDELFEIDGLELVAAMRIERLHRGRRQQRAEAEGDVGGAPDLGAGGVDRQRQALAAEILRPRNGVPAALGPALVGIRPARRGRDLAVVELDAVLVADLVERRQHVGREFAGFLQHGGHDVGVEIAVMAGFQGGLEAGAMVERQQHVRDRRAVGHGSLPRTGLAPYSHETREVSMGGRAGAGQGSSAIIECGRPNSSLWYFAPSGG